MCRSVTGLVPSVILKAIFSLLRSRYSLARAECYMGVARTCLPTDGGPMFNLTAVTALIPAVRIETRLDSPGDPGLGRLI